VGVNGTGSGGGGGGAGSTGSGGAASGTIAGTGTTLNGGNGGAGVVSTATGNPGSIYGGGGSGGYAIAGASEQNGGSGANGLVVLSWPAVEPTTQASNITFTGITNSQITINWTVGSGTNSIVLIKSGSAINSPPVDATTYTASTVWNSGSQIGTGNYVVYTSTGNSVTVTGLSCTTTYHVAVYTFNGSFGSENYLTTSPAIGNTISGGGYSGTLTIGPSAANFTTISSAITALGACGGITGPVRLALQSGYSSTVETFPLSIAAIPGASATNTVTIYPAVTGLKITSADATGTLNLNGVDYLIIDGRVGATGSTRDLTIENTVTDGYTVTFDNGATNKAIKYCNIKGRNTTSGEGVMWFGSSTPGNSNNTIDNCDIGPDAGTTPLVLIYSNASTGTTNANNSVTNCLLHDYFVSGGASSGINCNINNTAWTITGNSFYQTASRTASAATGYDGIAIFSGDGYTISNNYIGGSSASCGGGALTITGGFNNTFYGIYFYNGLATTNTCSLQGNVINNISFQTTPSVTGNLYFVGMHLRDGKINIGNITGNTIGSATGTGGITINISNASAGTFYNSGIEYYAVSGLVQNNTIGSIAINCTAAGSGAINFDGIFSVNALQNAGITISGNTIGSASSASSIQTTGNATVPVFVRGISFGPANTGDITVSGNTIANILNNSATTSSYIRGIECFGTARTGTISGNVIRDLTSASSSTYNDGSAAVSGIVVTNSGNSHLISQNSIYKLTSTHATAAFSFNGIVCNTDVTIERNLIYSLTLSSSSTLNSSLVSAIQISPPSGITVCNVKNNMIRLGFDGNGNVINLGTKFIGIWDYWGDNYIYNNSIYIGGQISVSTPIPVACIYNDNNNSIIQNNILFNDRSYSDNNNLALLMGITYYAQACNYNCLYRPGGVGYSLAYRNGIRYADLAAWQSSGLGFDANSVSNEPGFVDELGATPNLHMRPSAGTCSDNGTVIAAVTNDFDGDSRSATPDIGADEYAFAGLIWNGSTSTAWNTGSNWTINTIPKKADVVLIPTGKTNYPVITSAYDAGAYNTTIESGASITVGPNAKLDLTGNITNSNGVDGIVIKSDASGTGSLLHYRTGVQATIERYVTGDDAIALRKYHFVSIPLVPSNNSLSGIFLYSYLFDFDEALNDWHGLGTPTTTPLDETRGYMVYAPFDAGATYLFQGEMNSNAAGSAFTALTTYSGASAGLSNKGWNLVPNPFPSAIDWDVATGSGWTKTNIDNTIYLWHPGPTYALSVFGTYINGVGVNGGSRYIAQGQSFLVHANNNSPILSMDNRVRVHNSQPFLKNGVEIIPDLLRLKATTDLSSDETVIHFMKVSTENFDNEFDAYKLTGGADAPYLATITQDGTKLSINSLPYGFGERLIPLSFSLNKASSVTFTATGMENFTMVPPIYLEDLLLGTIIDLQQQPVYTFNYQPGQTNRFQLRFNNITADKDAPMSEGNIFYSRGKININVPSMEGNDAVVQVFDIAGRQLSTTRITINGIVQVKAPVATGVYIVRVLSGNGAFTERVLIQ